VALNPGQMLAHYRLEKQIGEGGMGVVWLAEDTRLGRRVALKVLPASMAGDAARRARFEREARAIAALNHPNIVTLHSVEESEGITFLTMELVDGRRLREMVPKDGLGLQKILEYSLAIADALAAAHEQGVIHRDLKPDNIMVTGSGRVKVLDFGLAKMREAAEESPNTSMPTTAVTEEGKIVGTVAYMSPEQAEGKTLDQRSDIFSFGVVLYEMSTGRRPFQGDTAISTISAILKDTPVPPHEINTSLPPQLARIVRRCLEKEPDRRYHSTPDLRNDLRELKEDSESGELSAESVAAGVARKAAAGPRSSSRPLLLGAGAVVVLAAIAVGAWLWRGAKPGHEPAASIETVIQMSRATTDGKVSDVAISPNGRYLAYVRREGPLNSLRLKQLATGTEVEVVSPGDASLASPSFTPDGDFLQYILVEPRHTSGTAYRVSVLGGTPRSIMDGVDSLSCSPDGTKLAVTAGGMDEAHLSIAGFDGQDPRTIASRHLPDHFDSAAAWSSDGRSIAIVSHSFGKAQQILLIDPETGEERPLDFPALKSFTDVRWVPGRQALLVAGSDRPTNQGGTSPQIWEASLDGKLRPLTRDLNSYFDVDVTADGATVTTLQIEVRSGIAVASAKDGVPGSFEEIFPVSAARAGDEGLAWLGPDRLIHTMVQSDQMQVFVTDVTTKSTRALSSGIHHRNPSASRDGRTIVVTGDEGTTSNLWRLDPGSGRAERLTEGVFNGFPTVTPDGSWVVYASIQEAIKLWKVPTAGGSPVEVAPVAASCDDISAVTGEALCWVYDLSAGSSTPSIIPLEGGEPRAVAGLPRDASEVKFGPDGRSIDYVISGEGAYEIWRIPAGGGEPRRLARFPGEEIGDFAWSPDGRRLAVEKRARSGDVVLLKRGAS